MTTRVELQHEEVAAGTLSSSVKTGRANEPRTAQTNQTERDGTSATGIRFHHLPIEHGGKCILMCSVPEHRPGQCCLSVHYGGWCELPSLTVSSAVCRAPPTVSRAATGRSTRKINVTSTRSVGTDTKCKNKMKYNTALLHGNWRKKCLSLSLITVESG